MSFVVQRTEGRGLVVNQYGGDVLRIGRGTNCELRSDNPAVSLVHAEIVTEERGYSIGDKGSITGTYVNGRVVEMAPLSKGDTIQAGDLTIEVQLAEAGRPMFLRVTSNAAAAAGYRRAAAEKQTELGGSVAAERIDYAGSYRLYRPYFTKTSVIALLLVFSFIVLSEVIRPERQTMFMPGEVSSAHMRARDAANRPIARNCGACHDPWRAVSEVKCIGCHGREPHASRQASPPPCMSCHTEHRGMTKLALVSDARCVYCHGDLRKHIEGNAPPAIPVRITSFGADHPEFKLPPDADTMRFNHRLHLKRGGILSANGRREVLTCTGCHRLVETRGVWDPAPLTFAGACQRCHRLTFDARFPNTEIPHGGDPGLVYGFIITTYAGTRDFTGRSPQEIRRILAQSPPPSVNEQAVVNAGQVIKAKCALCHVIDRAGDRETARPPVLRTSWLERVKFTHTSHRQIDCEACHANARNSFRTSDVLIPEKQSCTRCHAAASRTASSACISCHTYHDRSRTTVTAAALFGKRRRATAPIPPPTGDVTGMVQSLLLYGSLILLLVILVPVAFAIFTRLRGAAPAARPVARAAEVPRAQPVAAVPPPPAPPAAPAAAVAAPPPSAAPSSTGTVIMNRPGASSPVVSGGTVVVEWFGYVRCLAGPLQGQTFVLDEGGLTIGRDPSFASVVVRDDRVSKLHVTVKPMNGKVYAIDEASKNGTYIGKVGEKITRAELKKGDRIILADNVATFEYEV